MELKVKLKQHTPMIHFQHDQRGATLRATEVRPKLSKYLRQKYGLKEDAPLRYRMTIRYLSEPFKQEPKGGMYFGNMGSDKQSNAKLKKELLGDKLEVCFNTYFDSRLKGWIEESFAEFLALENFGTRNNKGYGCFFYVNKKAKDMFEDILKHKSPSPVYVWSCRKDDCFLAIKTFYSLLKSGINLEDDRNPIMAEADYNKLEKEFPDDFCIINDNNLSNIANGKYEINLKKAKKDRLRLQRDLYQQLEQYKPRCKTYYKSLLFQYFKDKGITWDKKAIKSYFIPAMPSDDFESDNKKFVRAFLGVGDQHNYYKYNKVLNISSPDFDRVPSPIVFKVFNHEDDTASVYFYAKDFYKSVQGKSFSFNMGDPDKTLTLETPNEFDINDYLEFAVDRFKNNLSINNRNSNTFGIVKNTDSILQTIKHEIKRLGDQQ